MIELWFLKFINLNFAGKFMKKVIFMIFDIPSFMIELCFIYFIDLNKTKCVKPDEKGHF